AIADHCFLVSLSGAAEGEWQYRDFGSAHIAGVTERIAARLRPHRQSMRLGADAYRPDRSTCGVDGVDDVVVAAGDPQQLAVGADVSHVGAAAARDRPRRLDFAGPEIEHRHASFALRRSVDLVRTAVVTAELLAAASR